MRSCLFAVLTLFATVGPALSGQNADNETPTIRTTTREVILDVIVRDKHHHSIADIRPEEIEVLEDGVQQKINAFRNVQGADQLQMERKLANGVSAGRPAEESDSSEARHGSATNLRELNFDSVVLA